MENPYENGGENGSGSTSLTGNDEVATCGFYNDNDASFTVGGGGGDRDIHEDFRGGWWGWKP